MFIVRGKVYRRLLLINSVFLFQDLCLDLQNYFYTSCTSVETQQCLLCFFPHYLINGTIFEKIKLLQINMCVLVFSTNFCCYQKNPGSYFTQMYVSLHVKCPLFLSDFNQTLIFSTAFRKILSYQI